MNTRCDKITADRCKYCQLNSTDDGPAYRTVRQPLSGLVDNLTTRCGDLRTVAKFSTVLPVWGTKFHGKYPNFGDTHGS